MFILVKGLLHTTMPKNLTDEERTKRSQRRRNQRERAKQRERDAKLFFYQPNILNGFESQPCSVCGCDTRSYFSSLAHIALCSGKCEKLYADQWRHFDLDLTKGSIIIYNGRRYKYDTNKLVKNSNGEVCIEAWDSRGSFRDSKILIPFSQRHEILQLL